MKRKLTTGFAVSLLCALGFYFCCGFFVVQPIGAIPEGGTILYWRAGTQLPFVASADGIQLEKTGSVSLLGRAIATGLAAESITDRKIMKLPYSRLLYQISTGGKEFDR